jgi:hypothetical protein
MTPSYRCVSQSQCDRCSSTFQCRRSTIDFGSYAGWLSAGIQYILIETVRNFIQIQVNARLWLNIDTNLLLPNSYPLTYLLILSGMTQSALWQCLWAKRSGVRLPSGPIPAQPPIQWQPTDLSSGFSWRGVKVTIHLLLVLRLRMSGAIPLLHLYEVCLPSLHSNSFTFYSHLIWGCITSSMRTRFVLTVFEVRLCRR